MSLAIIEKATILGMVLNVYGDSENPLFLAKDIAERIEHSKTSMMIENLEEGVEKLRETIFTSGQNRDMWFLTEDGVYEVLMTSRKPIAKEFRKGFKEFLKSWRKGLIKVVDNTPKVPQSYAQALLEAGRLALENERLEIENKRQANTIDVATKSLLGVEKDTSRRNINSLVKSLSEEYCIMHNLNPRANISDVYMAIYRDFCGYANLNFTDIQKARIQYKKKEPTVPLSTKKSYIQVLEERGLTDTLLQYLREVKIENI